MTICFVFRRCPNYCYYYCLPFTSYGECEYDTEPSSFRETHLQYLFLSTQTYVARIYYRETTQSYTHTNVPRANEMHRLSALLAIAMRSTVFGSNRLPICPRTHTPTQRFSQTSSTIPLLLRSLFVQLCVWSYSCHTVLMWFCWHLIQLRTYCATG